MLYTNGGSFREQLLARAATQTTDAQAQHSSDCTACCVACSGAHCCPQCPPCVAATGTCNGEEVGGKHTKLPFVHPAGNCTTTLCAVFATSMDGPWSMRNVDSPCTNNAVPFQVIRLSLSLSLSLSVCVCVCVCACVRASVCARARVIVYVCRVPCCPMYCLRTMFAILSCTVRNTVTFINSHC